MDASLSEYGQRHAKPSHTIAQAQMALHEGVQAEGKMASRGLAQHSFTAQSPATTNTGANDAVTLHSLLKKLRSAKFHLDAAQVESKGSSDDEADIFPASMAGRVPGAGFSPGSGLANGKRHSLGGQALLMSQSMVHQVNGQDPSPKSEGSSVRHSSQQHTEFDSWLKLDMLDKGLGAEEEELRAKLPTGSSVPDLILREPEAKPKRSPNPPPPSQKGLLDRLEQRFSSVGQLQLNGQKSFSPNGPRSPSSLAGEPTVFGKGVRP